MADSTQTVTVGPGGRPLHPVLITASVMAASIMQAIDTTIATIALPHMQGSVSGTQDQMVWVLTSYIVSAAIGSVAMLPESSLLNVRFDLFGFAALSLGIGSLLMMLDRGELKDWFS